MKKEITKWFIILKIIEILGISLAFILIYVVGNFLVGLENFCGDFGWFSCGFIAILLIFGFGTIEVEKW